MKKKRGFFRRFWWAFLLVPVVAVAGVAGTIMYVYAHTPLPNAPPGPQTTYVYDRNGRLITTFHSEVNRTIIPLSDIPPDMKHAVIAIEDKDYYRHGGVSYVSILRAAVADVMHRRVVQGGSTIAQQYVKNVFTGSERTFGRKFREAILAVKLDHAFSKEEILGKYLNTVYFGNGAYGIQAAAQTYWGIPARRLDTVQSATLAALISSPGSFDPIQHPDQAKARRDLVLTKMAEQGYITHEQATSLQQEPVEVGARKPRSSPAAYFIDYVRRVLQQRYGVGATFTDGLRVTTTLDRSMQAAAERAVAGHLTSAKDPSAALVAIDPRTGAIRAMVGGRNFNQVKFNLATQARRQAGSAFKPFTLTAAMEQRIDPKKALWKGPPSITIPDRRCYTHGEPWKVSNYADESAGTMNLLDATAHSVNTIFAQLAVVVGPDRVAEVANTMGIRSELQPVCSITLGTQPVTPLEMTNAYATLAARGVYRAPEALSVVRNADREVLQRSTFTGEQVLEPNDADLVTLALQGVVQRGTGTAANIGRPVAGKTGTAQGYVDAWFCGYTPQLAACVWMGYQKGEIPMENVEGFAHVFGGSLPAEIWHDFMSAALANVPVASFHPPSFIGYDVRPGVTVTPKPSPSPTPSPIPSPSPTPTFTTPPPTTPPPTTPPSPSPSATA